MRTRACASGGRAAREDTPGDTRLVGLRGARCAPPPVTAEACRARVARARCPSSWCHRTSSCSTPAARRPTARSTARRCPPRRRAPRRRPATSNALPADEIERQIAAIWRDVLQRSRGRHRRQLLRPGRPLAARVQVHRRLREVLGAPCRDHRPVPLPDDPQPVRAPVSTRPEPGMRAADARAALRRAARSRRHDR